MLQRSFKVQPVLDPDLGAQAEVSQADTALVIMDTQYNQCTNGNFEAVENALYNLGRARKAFCEANKPVFLVVTIPPQAPWDAHLNGEHRLYEPDLTGTFEIVRKWAHSAFRTYDRGEYLLNGTAAFTKTLRADYPNVKHLVKGGFNLGRCLLESAADAVDLGYKVTLLADCAENCYINVAHDFDYAAAREEDLRSWRRMDVTTLDEFITTRLCAAPAGRPARPGSPTPAG